MFLIMVRELHFTSIMRAGAASKASEDMGLLATQSWKCARVAFLVWEPESSVNIRIEFLPRRFCQERISEEHLRNGSGALLYLRNAQESVRSSTSAKPMWKADHRYLGSSCREHSIFTVWGLEDLMFLFIF